MQAQAGQPKDVVFYITAHQDDWQLFMGSNAYDDVQRRRTKVIFICLTAGQAADLGDTYWKSRETGCLNAIQAATCLSASSEALPPAGTQTINKHEVAMYRYKNTAAYFFRLPDGGYKGDGYPRTNFETIAKLKNKKITSLTSLDKTATYTSWGDLVGTVQQLMKREINDGARVWVNAPDLDKVRNPDDHPDHMMAGVLARVASDDMDCRQHLYKEYSASKEKVNLTLDQTANQTALYSAYCKAISDAGQPSGWNKEHLVWIGRQYFRLRHNVPNTPSQPGPATAHSVPMPATSADTATVEPVQLTLEGNYPNPFDQSSLVAYYLPNSAPVLLRIFDVTGKLIVTLVEKKQVAGRYEVWLDANQFPSSGQYICSLQVGSERRQIRMQVAH
ncbi:PIG-L family deacetylase [Hymenobacter jejuensis]|uniref:PIG-L family deacetylase n=1 Tax=Hymenobacter jejuensis TaxID=2502781 RepID=UPI0013FCFDA1|nr:PIG-L family deacetylase [Hymenobacter jejuensis]